MFSARAHSIGTHTHTNYLVQSMIFDDDRFFFLLVCLIEYVVILLWIYICWPLRSIVHSIGHILANLWENLNICYFFCPYASSVWLVDFFYTFRFQFATLHMKNFNVYDSRSFFFLFCCQIIRIEIKTHVSNFFEHNYEYDQCISDVD